MDKSALQIRAETILQRFSRDARRPIVIEFAGVPKAGKTSTIGQLQGFLKRCGFRVQVVVERASICPIRDKKHATFNVWTACTTLAQILEHTQDPPRIDDPHILILDRGIFDAIAWLNMMDRLSRIRTVDRESIEKFLLLPEWQRRVTGVIVMTASPDDAMRREGGLLPVAQAEGSIMNPDVLHQMLATTRECAASLKSRFRIREVDTSSAPTNNQKAAVEAVAEQVLDWMEEELREDILYLTRERITKLFGTKTAVRGLEASAVMEAYSREGAFAPRSEVENDASAVQALPVVVVRRKNGDVLQLRRSERQESNPLHEKIVIWAGGHVRKEDGMNGEAIRRGAQRELQEELRLNVESDELRFLGAVYVDCGGKTSRHVAIVFEWRAETDDVAVTLSKAEFFERRGTSLSGTFIPLDELANDIGAGKITEIWSIEIAREMLSLMISEPQSNLF